MGTHTCIDEHRFVQTEPDDVIGPVAAPVERRQIGTPTDATRDVVRDVVRDAVDRAFARPLPPVVVGDLLIVVYEDGSAWAMNFTDHRSHRAWFALPSLPDTFADAVARTMPPTVEQLAGSAR